MTKRSLADDLLRPLSDEEKEFLDQIDRDNERLLRDEAYQKYLDFHDEETRRKIDADHASCTLDSPFGMCKQCEADYEIGKRIGAEDCEMGISLEMGQAAWVGLRPHMPRNSKGVLNAYFDGYNGGLLRKMGKAN